MRPRAPEETRRRKTLALLAAATAIGGLGLAAGCSAGALLAEDMTGSTAWAGVPLGVLVAGSAASALLISRRTSRAGRAAGLALGYGVGTAGAVIVVAAAVVEDFALGCREVRLQLVELTAYVLDSGLMSHTRSTPRPRFS